MRYLLILLFLFAPLTARAATGWDAASLGLSAGGAWMDENGPNDRRDFELGGRGALSLTPHVALVGATSYGVTAAYLRGSVGARLTATDVNDRTFSVGVGISRHFTSKPPNGLEEWAGEAAIGWKPLADSPLYVTGLAAVGLESQRRLASAAVVYPLHLGGGQ